MSKYKKSKGAHQQPIQRATRIPLHFSYSSTNRMLVVNGQVFSNVGGDWLNRVYGG